ncbi:MAG TPA: hypothetical protein VEA69_04995 [Tepidisphaeraceae bacterium]|nr:hypothetical protein [Tepidisphaeraceae bacterium]
MSTVADAGVAPADARGHARWARWKVILAYAVMAGLAAWSVWMIDAHVLRVAAEMGAK